MATVKIAIEAENNAETFWALFHDQYPGLALTLEHVVEIEVAAEVWEEIQKIEGFSDGPSYAPTAMVEVDN